MVHWGCQGQGVAGGLWVDRALKSLESEKITPKEIDWLFLEKEVSRIQQLVAVDLQRKDDTSDGYHPIGQETVTGF